MRESTYLLDTDMFSYIAKGASPAARREWLRLSQDRGATVCISVISAILVTRDRIFERVPDLHATVNWATDL